VTGTPKLLTRTRTNVFYTNWHLPVQLIETIFGRIFCLQGCSCEAGTETRTPVSTVALSKSAQEKFHLFSVISPDQAMP
jgi:hypothetical protein